MFGQLLAGGIAVGCIYALIGLGYSLIYSASALMSFVQGEIFMLGAYVAYTIYVSFQIPFALAVLLAILIMFGFGVVLQRGMISPLLKRGAQQIQIVLATIGLSIFLKNFAMIVWGSDVKNFPSALGEAPIRWIVDDCAKFVEREIRRGRRYDAIIMDPPSYGRGPTGEVWKLEDNLYPFVELCAGVLSDEPLFIIINSYTTGLAPSVLTYILETVVSRKFGGRTVSDEIGLPVSETGLVLPCGATGRWTGDR